MFIIFLHALKEPIDFGIAFYATRIIVNRKLVFKFHIFVLSILLITNTPPYLHTHNLETRIAGRFYGTLHHSLTKEKHSSRTEEMFSIEA